MSVHVFTYGSLMFPQVWQRVVRGEYRSSAARLDGHARFEIAGETYPGMIVRPGASVEGVLYFDVSPADVAALDAFEGEEYRRDTVRVALPSGELVDAGTYLYLLPQKLSDSPWRPEAFQMARFIGSYCREKLGE
ncbi:MAG TPA: gamma-glutamylcyclotransferase family protein [Noviherbaspirillum sp.]|nr:gamma-glutamylcyclotransferase family protein [Noviherbaspirillum sp.]